MKKYLLIIATLLFSTAAQTYAQTLPITAASFPYTIIDGDSGRIEFFAKLKGFSGSIDGTGRGPGFFRIKDDKIYSPCQESYPNAYYLQFNSNDGEGHGGLCGWASLDNTCGTGSFGSWTYERIYGSQEEANKWHCYQFRWNKAGLPELNRKEKVAVYIDGKRNTTSWGGVACPDFAPLTGGTFNLITTGNRPFTPITGEIIMDELRVYNGKGQLVLYNKLGSKEEIENSIVGPNGSFNGYGDAHFVKGAKGYALSAHPVYSDVDVAIAAANTSSIAAANKTFTLQILPNPVSGNLLHLRITNSTSKNVQIAITDMQGKTFISEKIILNNGALNKAIDVAALPRGLYILKATSGKEKHQVKFVKAN